MLKSLYYLNFILASQRLLKKLKVYMFSKVVEQNCYKHAFQPVNLIIIVVIIQYRNVPICSEM